MKEQTLTLNKMLLEAFPELTKDFKAYVEWQDGIDTGAFLTYEDVFRPFIENAIANNNNVILERVSSFLETIFVSGDKYAVNVVSVGILEGLKANCNNEAVRAFLLPNTLKEFEEIEY